MDLRIARDRQISILVPKRRFRLGKERERENCRKMNEFRVSCDMVRWHRLSQREMNKRERKERTKREDGGEDGEEDGREEGKRGGSKWEKSYVHLLKLVQPIRPLSCYLLWERISESIFNIQKQKLEFIIKLKTKN